MNISRPASALPKGCFTKVLLASFINGGHIDNLFPWLPAWGAGRATVSGPETCSWDVTTSHALHPWEPLQSKAVWSQYLEWGFLLGSRVDELRWSNVSLRARLLAQILDLLPKQMWMFLSPCSRYWSQTRTKNKGGGGGGAWLLFLLVFPSRGHRFHYLDGFCKLGSTSWKELETESSVSGTESRPSTSHSILWLKKKKSNCLENVGCSSSLN